MAYQKENDLLLQSFLSRVFLEGGWKNPSDPTYGNSNRVEFFLNAKCNLKCKYCYLANFGPQLYPKTSNKKTLEHLSLVLDWMVENEYYPEIELFSGEPLVQKIGLDALRLILDKFSQTEKRPAKIVIPTNFTFCLQEKSINKVEKLLTESRSLKMPIFLSASVDGKYMERNRPFRKSNYEPRDDAFYDRVFTFAKKWKCGFHPMVYSGHIEDWQKNFLWFQENFKKLDMPFNNIYLLEVRNAEWSRQQIRSFGDFINFLITWTFRDRCREKVQRYVDFLFKRKGYNMLTSPLSSIGRGIGCSIQSNPTIRIGDLALVPCHRTSYSQNVLAHLKIENSKITGFESVNPELAIAVYTFDSNTLPYCEQCLIKKMCSKGCLGSQLEVTGDMFTPIPTVCALEHHKILTMVRTYQDLGIYDHILGCLNPEKLRAFETFREVSK